MRITRLVALSVFVLIPIYIASAYEEKKEFDALDNFDKDFTVAAGDAKSWKVNKKVFECNGKPNGYICTKKSYSNYVMTLEFRYPDKAGNTGVRDDPACSRQAEDLRLAVEISPESTSLGACPSSLWIYPHASHLRKVDHESVVAHSVARDSVAASPDR